MGQQPEPNEWLGRETVDVMRALATRPGLGVVNTLYAALYELARRTEQSPRVVLDVFFSEAPADAEWRDAILPALEAMLRKGEAAA
jgi:hypothetical protein